MKKYAKKVIRALNEIYNIKYKNTFTGFTLWICSLDNHNNLTDLSPKILSQYCKVLIFKHQQWKSKYKIKTKTKTP